MAQAPRRHPLREQPRQGKPKPQGCSVGEGSGFSRKEVVPFFFSARLSLTGCSWAIRIAPADPASDLRAHSPESVKHSARPPRGPPLFGCFLKLHPDPNLPASQSVTPDGAPPSISPAFCPFSVPSAPLLGSRMLPSRSRPEGGTPAADGCQVRLLDEVYWPRSCPAGGALVSRTPLHQTPPSP